MPGDGTVTITGTADGKTDMDGPFGHGTLIRSGSVQFAIHGDPPGRKVRCTGELYEARHGEPSATTTGQLIAIRWRPQQAHAYRPGIELRTTSDWRQHAPEGHPSASAFEFTIRVSD